MRDGDETLELLVIQHGAGDGSGGPAKLVGGLDLVGEEELDVLGQGRALLGRLQLQMQLDERVDVARNDFVGDGIDEGLPSCCDEDEDAGARPLVARVADLEEGFGEGERASARLDADSFDPLCGLISSGFCEGCDILGRDLPEVLGQGVGHVWDSVKVLPQSAGRDQLTLPRSAVPPRGARSTPEGGCIRSLETT